MLRSVVDNIVRFCTRWRNGIVISNAAWESQVEQVNDLADSLAKLTDVELQHRLTGVRDRVQTERRFGDAAILALAIIREAAGRTLSMRPYDVQMLAAIAMNDGSCIQMQTGEGKTLAAAVIVCLRVLAGQSVHVLTFNDYLAERDSDWMRPLYEFFGFSVAHVKQGMPRDQRQHAYAQQITYVTAKEAGFDSLRDQLCQEPSDRVQQPVDFAVIDEADSILIDEARIPLVIATEAEKDETDLSAIAQLVRTLRRGRHYAIKVSGRNISLTDSGIAFVERQLGIRELHSEEHMDVLARVNLALQADILLTRDVDYIVRNGRIELIDEFTGRVATNRKWPGGLQAALEAKEGLEVQPQGRILNSITLQQYATHYPQLAGMTGTAVEATEELSEFYDLKVVVIPPNRPCIRVDHPDRVFRTKQEKQQALLQEVVDQHARGRPVLIGTASVDESETLATAFRRAGISCRILNATNDAREAEIIAEAGDVNAVTISTNMAGRGTDICLGGRDEHARDRVIDVGGLYVIGTNRHESRRIDNQLRGRCGRQGDPGETRFFVSLQDDLIARHGIAELVIGDEGVEKFAVDSPEMADRIAHVQRVMEGESFEVRRTLRKYSYLLEVQRKTITRDRDDLLFRRRRPTVLAKRDPELYEQLIQRWGESLVNESERRATLILLDWMWSDHLAHAAEIRESVHLASYGGFNAIDVFNKDMNREFEGFLNRVSEAVLYVFQHAEFTESGIDFDAAGLKAPSSTWTFMVNDNPRGAILNQIIRGLVQRLRQSFRLK